MSRIFRNRRFTRTKATSAVPSDSFWIYASHFIIDSNFPTFLWLEKNHRKARGVGEEEFGLMEIIRSKQKDTGNEKNNHRGKGYGSKIKYQCHVDPNTAGVPVDYSFRKAENLSELENGLPRMYRVGLPKTGRSKRYVSRSIWANYNNFIELSSVVSLVNVTLERPEIISWLDVSFNQIQTISPEILLLENLIILYLHGNKIQFLMEIAKLKDLKKLKTLTLHGNPVEEIPNYRLHIIKLLPHLKNLDFSMIADRDRAFAKSRPIT